MHPKFINQDTPLKVAGVLLLVLCSLKWSSAALAWTTLGRRVDPVLGLPVNWVMLGTGLIECGAAWFLLWPGHTRWEKALVMVFLGQGWLMYQWFHAARAR